MTIRYVLAGLAVLASGSAQARDLDTGDCVRDCAATIVIGKTFHVVARDREGEIILVRDTQISSKAEKVGGISQSGGYGFQTGSHDGAASSSSGSSHTTQERYETETEYIVVLTTFVYDSDGAPIDVQVNVIRTPKPAGEDDIP